MEYYTRLPQPLHTIWIDTGRDLEYVQGVPKLNLRKILSLESFTRSLK